jgi:hypothetical protein
LLEIHHLGGYTTIPLSNSACPPPVIISVDEDKDYKVILMLFVIGFFVHPAWIFAFFMSRKKGGKTKRLGNISCAMFFVSLICVAIIIIAIALPVGLAQARYYTYVYGQNN